MMCVRVYSESGKKPPGEEARCQPVCRGQGAFSRLRPHSQALPGGLWAHTALAGAFPLRDVPKAPEAVTPSPCTTVLCQNGCCSWHLPGSLFFFPKC